MEAEAGAVGPALQDLKLQPDRLGGLPSCVRSLARGRTLSISDVYVCAVPLVPLGELFDRQVAIRMGQANVRLWSDPIRPLLEDGNPLGTGELTTHRLPLDAAPEADRLFQRKEDSAIKIVLRPDV
jgi:threonine dehydrogenase-like Zn-dependent dehydrogenase